MKFFITTHKSTEEDGFYFEAECNELGIIIQSNLNAEFYESHILAYFAGADAIEHELKQKKAEWIKKQLQDGKKVSLSI